MEPDHESTGVLGAETSLPLSTLWRAMVDKIYNPAKYLPNVLHVTTKETGRDSTYREMSLSNGHTMKEDIFADSKTGRIEFRVVDRDLVVVNQYRGDKHAIEYVLEDKNGKILGWWAGMREATQKAIAGQYDIAQREFS